MVKLPLSVSVPAWARKVPLDCEYEPQVNAKLDAETSYVPFVTVITPEAFISSNGVTVFVELIVRFLNFSVVALNMDCATEPLKVTVPMLLRSASTPLFQVPPTVKLKFPQLTSPLR